MPVQVLIINLATATARMALQSAQIEALGLDLGTAGGRDTPDLVRAPQTALAGSDGSDR